MGRPQITPADLIAVRDGGEVDIGIDLALRDDAAAQLALLESRLLALALSMPRGGDLSGVDDAALQPPEFDLDTLGAYLRGELSDERLAAFEAAVRGHPARFAELVRFKNAYFGRHRGSATYSPRAAPAIDRIEVGRLTLRVRAGRTTLSWEGPMPARSAFRFESVLYDAPPPVDAEQIAELQQKMTEMLREISTRLRFADKTQRPEELADVRALLENLEQISNRHRSAVRSLRKQVGDSLGFGDDVDDTEVHVAIAGHKLRFWTTPGLTGGLTLRISPERGDTEFTWVRPGLDFTPLAATERSVHRLSPVREEALLLIDVPNEPTRVVRVWQG